MGFYRVHMLEVVSIEFLIVPLILLVGGCYTFFTAIFGVYATMREDACLVSLERRLSLHAGLEYTRSCPLCLVPSKQ